MSKFEGRMQMGTFLRVALAPEDYEKLQNSQRALRDGERNMHSPYDSRFPGCDAQQQCWQYTQDWKRCENKYGDKYMCKYWRGKAYQTCPSKWLDAVTDEFALPYEEVVRK